MDKYQEALNHVSEMGLSPEQIAAIFSDKAQNIEHLDAVLAMDKDAVIEAITPKRKVVIVEDSPKKKRG